MRFVLTLSVAALALTACKQKEIVNESTDKLGVGYVQLWSPVSKLKAAYGFSYCRSDREGETKCSVSTEKHSFRFHGLKVDTVDVTINDQTNLVTAVNMTYVGGALIRSSLDQAFNKRCLDSFDVDRAVEFDKDVRIFYYHLREVRATPGSKDTVCLLNNGTYLKASESYSKAGTGSVELFQLNGVFANNFNYIFDALERKRSADSRASSLTR